MQNKPGAAAPVNGCVDGSRTVRILRNKPQIVDAGDRAGLQFKIMAAALASAVVWHGPEGALLCVHLKFLVQYRADPLCADSFQGFGSLESGVTVCPETERAVAAHENGLGGWIGGKLVRHCLAELSESVMYGDKPSDEKAATAAGVAFRRVGRDTEWKTA